MSRHERRAARSQAQPSATEAQGAGVRGPADGEDGSYSALLRVLAVPVAAPTLRVVRAVRLVHHARSAVPYTVAPTVPVRSLERCPRCFRRNLFVTDITAVDIIVGWHVTTHYACRCGWHADVVSAREKD